MNITLLVNQDIPATLALNYLLPKLAEHKLDLLYTRKTKPSDACSQLINLGEFESSLDELGQKHGYSMEHLAHRYCGSYAQANQVNSHDLPLVHRAEPDLIISIRHMTILKEHVIQIPRHGVINLHSGLLPKYQGVMATFWAMLNQEKNIGSTLHYISDSNIDTGNIIEKTPLLCQYQESYLHNVLCLYKSGAESILNAVNRISQNLPLRSNAQLGQASYYSFPAQNDYMQFADQGLDLYKSEDSEFYLSLLQDCMALPAT